MGKIKNSIKKEFDSEPMYNEKYLEANVKSYNEKINTNFHNNKILKESSQFICLSVILIDSVFRTGKNYYPQVFLEECKYVVKEKISLSILLMAYKFLWRLEKILMKKILIKKTEYRVSQMKKNIIVEAFQKIIKYSYSIVNF